MCQVTTFTIQIVHKERGSYSWYHCFDLRTSTEGLLFRTEGLTSEGFIIQMDEIIELHIFPSLPEGPKQ